MMINYDVIVVGCGAAGASAFARLRNAGLRVLCLEAGARIGGRVRTEQVDDSSVVEMGAEWIEGEVGNATYELAQQFDVPLETTADLSAAEYFTSDGKLADQDLCRELLSICVDIDKAPPIDYPGTTDDYLKEKFLERISKTPHLIEKGQFSEDFFNTYMKANVVGPLKRSYDYKTIEGNQNQSWGSKGFHTVFGIIVNDKAEPLKITPDGILLNKEVIKIQWQGDNNVPTVKVSCKDGTHYAAKSVIATVSIGVLQNNMETLFEPPLPTAKQDIIKKITSEVIDKVCLEYDTKWWTLKIPIFVWSKEDIDAMPEEDKWLTEIVFMTNPKGNDVMRTAWLLGQAAKTMETLDLNVVKEKCEGIISRFMGKTYIIPKAKAVRRSTWYTDPAFCGSYSFRGQACDKAENLIEEIQAPLKDESGHPLVLFAGEATNPNKYATVHGAIESGRREAERVIAALNQNLTSAK